MSLKSDLDHVVTAYDRRRVNSKTYNHYALGHYLGAVERIVELVEGGAPLREAVSLTTNDRLETVLLKYAEKVQS